MSGDSGERPAMKALERLFANSTRIARQREPRVLIRLTVHCHDGRPAVSLVDFWADEVRADLDAIDG